MSSKSLIIKFLISVLLAALSFLVLQFCHGNSSLTVYWARHVQFIARNLFLFFRRVQLTLLDTFLKVKESAIDYFVMAEHRVNFLYLQPCLAGDRRCRNDWLGEALKLLKRLSHRFFDVWSWIRISILFNLREQRFLFVSKFWLDELMHSLRQTLLSWTLSSFHAKASEWYDVGNVLKSLRLSYSRDDSVLQRILRVWIGKGLKRRLSLVRYRGHFYGGSLLW